LQLDKLRIVRHGTRIATKTQSVATGAAHKLNLNESAEKSQRASGAARMPRNAINDTANKNWFEKNEPRGKSFFHQAAHSITYALVMMCCLAERPSNKCTLQGSAQGWIKFTESHVQKCG
jgi:hypothetical protein